MAVFLELGRGLVILINLLGKFCAWVFDGLLGAVVYGLWRIMGDFTTINRCLRVFKQLFKTGLRVLGWIFC